MKKRSLSNFVILLASIILATGLYGKKHKGIELPKSIGSFLYQDFHDYEKENPGLGRSFAYHTSDGVTATIYVYDLNRRDIENGADGVVVVESARLTAREIEMMAKQQGYAELSVSNFRKVSVGAVKMWFSRISFQDENGVERNSLALLTGYKSQIFKVRITGGSDAERFDAVVEFFLKDLGNKVLKGGKKKKQDIVLSSEIMNSANGALHVVYTAIKQTLGDPYSFETERSALELVALALEKEGNEKDETFNRDDKSLVEFHKAFRAGFLNEYVWVFARNYVWERPEGLRLKAFQQWISEEMPDHELPLVFSVG